MTARPAPAAVAAPTRPPTRYRVRWSGTDLLVSSPDPELWPGIDGQRDPIRLGTFDVTAVDEDAGSSSASHGCAADAASETDDRPENDGPSVHDEPSATGPLPTIVHEPDGEPAAARDGDRVVVRGPSSFWLTDERLGCVVVQWCDRMLLRRGRMILHGAVVDVDGAGVLLTGPSDAGKTSVAYTLCTRHGARLMSNDHAVIDHAGPEPLVLPGRDRIFAFRSHALWLLDPDRYRRLYGEPDDLRPHVRRRATPAELGVAVGTEAVPLRRIYHVGVGTTATPASYPTPATRAWIGLHADATGRVRASTLLLFDGAGNIGPLLPDCADDRTVRAAADGVTRLVDGRLVYDLRGTPEWCAQAVVDAVRGAGEGGRR